jgi:hypothetical protein
LIVTRKIELVNYLLEDNEFEVDVK